MPHNRLKNAQNPNQVIQQSGSADEHMYILNCATPQENILRNNEAFTHTLSGTQNEIYTSIYLCIY